ncbi:FAD-dependent pyridine nucleotide-disulfide oxidoreductase [Leifsonia rubra CMS 76R]|nr:FAD-dependent pyridine nucleotide-disulfide oxidoreductase [Leifsonia rubra CMS 76R]
MLGGGIGGVVAANRLRRRLGRRHRVVLIDRSPEFSLAASYLWVMTGQRTARQISRPLRSLERRGIDVVIGEITSISPERRSVTVDGRELTGDHLVVTLGAEQVAQTIPGMTDVGHTFATLPGARKLAIELDAIDRGRLLIVTGSPVYRCPAAPYEAALLSDAHLRQRGVRSKVEITVHAAEPMPMGVAGVNVAEAVMQMLASRGIDYRPSHQISKAEPGRAHFSEGGTEDFDLLAYMPPIAPPSVITGSTLAGPGGWIEADRHTLRTSHENVWAIGDNVQMPLTTGKPLPRAGVFAHAQAEVVADSIAAEIAGKPSSARFDGHGGCFIEVGRGRAGYGAGNFYSDPAPEVRMRPPSRFWHYGKVAFEQRVLRGWF